MKKYIILLLFSCHVSAVYVNQKGLGEVLLIPYYTVNNNLNTLVTVTNTGQRKAIKINIREGLNGFVVMSYNVYLDGGDTWSFVLTPDISTIAGFEGQESASLLSTDNSCAPFLDKTGQEFSPDALVDGPQNLSRAREGFIEIIEMGLLNGLTVGFIVDCAVVEEAWETDGMWHEESGGDVNLGLFPGRGGLMVEADIISVAEGVNYSIPVVALDDFFAADTIAHVSPNDSNLSLDAAKPVARIMTSEKNHELAFDSGIDAVTAVLMATKLTGTYALDDVVNGISEWVLVQPTRRFYLEPNQDMSLPPYNANKFVVNCPDSAYGGVEFTGGSYDRESLNISYDPCGGFNCPFNKRAICGTVFVQSLALPGVEQGIPEITESNNYDVLLTPEYHDPGILRATQNGWTVIMPFSTRALVGTDIHTSEPVRLFGLPIIGITLQQFTNAGAADGLLARYGGSHLLRSEVWIFEQ